MSIHKLIRDARARMKLTEEQFGEKLGVTRGTIQQWEKEGGTAPSRKRQPEVAKLLGISVAELMSGGSNVEAGPAIRGKVPLISWIKAGEWSEASDPFVPGDAEAWYECPVTHSDGAFVLRVRGDSMTAPHGNTRTYPDGCLIFVEPERRNPINGERVIARLVGSNEVTFKVYKNEDGRQWLQPLNPSHEPIREPFKVLGTVLGKWEEG